MNKVQIEYEHSLTSYQGRRSAIILVSLFVSQVVLLTGILVLFDLQSISKHDYVYTR